jgi:hypothetical protein
MRDDASCLVIMPFGSEAHEQFHHNLVYENVIKGICKEAGFKPERIDKVWVGGPLIGEIVNRLRNVDLVVADCSGNNPNVFFEIGFRYAQGRAFVCISNQPSKTAFWAKNFQVYDYINRDKRSELVKAIKSSLAESSTRSSCENELTKLLEKVRPAGSFRNPFQDRVAAWRIERAREQVGEIQQGGWVSSARTPIGQVAHTFEGILELLEEGEEYWTVTNMSFWVDAAVAGPVSPLLADNVKASRRGVKVKRVFLIDENEWDHPTTREPIEKVLLRHQEAVKKVDESRQGHMDVKCLVVPDFKRSLDTYGHFALACRPHEHSGGDSCVVVVPVKLNTSIDHLRLIFSLKGSHSQETAEYVTKFQKAYDSAYDLDTLLSNSAEAEPKFVIGSSGMLKESHESEKQSGNLGKQGSTNPAPQGTKGGALGRRNVQA